MTARPGNFCAPVGSADTTTAGTGMTCTVAEEGGRARWRSTGDQAGRRRDRRRLLAEAKKVGVKVPRGLADGKVHGLIAVTSAIRAETAVHPDGGGEPWIRVADLRQRLRLTRDETDTALRSLDRSSAVVLEPDPFPWRLTQRDRNAAVTHGGESCHLVLWIGDAPKAEG